MNLPTTSFLFTTSPNFKPKHGSFPKMNWSGPLTPFLMPELAHAHTHSLGQARHVCLFLFSILSSLISCQPSLAQSLSTIAKPTYPLVKPCNILSTIYTLTYIIFDGWAASFQIDGFVPVDLFFQKSPFFHPPVGLSVCQPILPPSPSFATVTLFTRSQSSPCSQCI